MKSRPKRAAHEKPPQAGGLRRGILWDAPFFVLFCFLHRKAYPRKRSTMPPLPPG